MRAWLLIDVESEGSADEIGEKLRSVSLQNAKQLVKGVMRKEVIVHVEAGTLADINSALQSFAGTPGVTGVTTLMIRPA
jgi:hypothetical protein